MKLQRAAIKEFVTYSDWLYSSEHSDFFIMGDHKYSCYSWMLAKTRFDLTQAVLVHVDKHFDYVVENRINGFLKLPTASNALKQSNYDEYPKFYIRNDNFIPAAIGVGLFNELWFVCKEEPPNEYICKRINGRKLKFQIFKTFDDFQEASYLLKSKTICLDIDLDYYNKESTTAWGMQLVKKDLILSQLSYLKNLPNVIVTTIALSAEYSGGKKAANILLPIIRTLWNISEKIEDKIIIPY